MDINTVKSEIRLCLSSIDKILENLEIYLNEITNCRCTPLIDDFMENAEKLKNQYLLLTSNFLILSRMIYKINKEVITDEEILQNNIDDIDNIVKRFI